MAVFLLSLLLLLLLLPLLFSPYASELNEILHTLQQQKQQSEIPWLKSGIPFGHIKAAVCSVFRFYYLAIVQLLLLLSMLKMFVLCCAVFCCSINWRCGVHVILSLSVPFGCPYGNRLHNTDAADKILYRLQNAGSHRTSNRKEIDEFSRAQYTQTAILKPKVYFLRVSKYANKLFIRTTLKCKRKHFICKRRSNFRGTWIWVYSDVFAMWMTVFDKSVDTHTHTSTRAWYTF